MAGNKLSPGANGVYNPADFMSIIDNKAGKRHIPTWKQKDLEQKGMKGLEEMSKSYGQKFTENINSLPEGARNYIYSEVASLINSGRKLNKHDLRSIEHSVRAKFPDDVPRKFDISSFVMTDKALAKYLSGENINKTTNEAGTEKTVQPTQPTQPTQSSGKQVDNTNNGVAGAKPGDWIIRSTGEKVVLNQGDIDYAKKAIGKKTEHESKRRENAQNYLKNSEGNVGLSNISIDGKNDDDGTWQYSMKKLKEIESRIKDEYRKNGKSELYNTLHGDRQAILREISSRQAEHAAGKKSSGKQGNK